MKGTAPAAKVNLFCLLNLFFSTAIAAAGSPMAPPRIKIVTSIFPLREFAEAVSGERGDVSQLLPPGAEVHSWHPRPTDILRLSSADVLLYNGADLEPWLEDLLRGVKNPDLRALEMWREIPLETRAAAVPWESHDAHDHNEGLDPHVWLDFQVDRSMVDTIAEVLVSLEPESEALFRANAAAYKQKLEALDEKYSRGLSLCPQKTFILGGHAAFGYLAARYGLTQIALYGLSPNSTPSPGQLIEVVKTAEKFGLDTVFFEAYVSDELARVIAKEIGGRVLVLNPGANLSRQEMEAGVTFLDIMTRNLENLKHGLGCR